MYKMLLKDALVYSKFIGPTSYVHDCRIQYNFYPILLRDPNDTVLYTPRMYIYLHVIIWGLGVEVGGYMFTGEGPDHRDRYLE